MFDFIDELKELKNNAVGYRYINYGGKLVIVQGYKDILFFDDTVVTLKLKTGELSILGTKLVVTEFSTNSIKIVGKINKIEVVGFEDENK